MKKVLCIVLAILAVFALAAAGGYGYAWYRNNHVFIQGDAYPLSAQELDLRDKDITVEYYNELKSLLPGCQIAWMVPFQGGHYDSASQSLTVSSLTLEEGEYLMTYLPNLTVLDAMDSRDYAVLTHFQDVNPGCTVLFQVDLGGTLVEPTVTELELRPGDYDYATLSENLIYLEDLKSLHLRTPELTSEQVEALEEILPELTVTCTVDILGTEYDTQTKELDLSALQSGDVAQAAEKLALLPQLEAVELMASGSSSLTKEDVKALIAAAPQVRFHYAFDFFGQTINSDTEEVVLKNVNIGDGGEAEVRSALDLLPNCKRMVLDNCKLSNEVLAKLREDYRDQTKVVWRVWFGKGSSLTDAQAIRAVYDLVDTNCHDLVYCEDVKYIDFGHNEYLNTCDFVAGMPNLEAIILSGSPIKNLDSFANCTKLKFLEIAFCGYIKDLSPLKNCTELQMLNMSNTKVEDLSPLDELPMTHLTLKDARVSAGEKSRYQALKPDCIVKDSGNQYGQGWRYVDAQNSQKYPYYALLSDVFGYPEGGTLNHAGMYTDKTVDNYALPE